MAEIDLERKKSGGMGWLWGLLILLLLLLLAWWLWPDSDVEEAPMGPPVGEVEEPAPIDEPDLGLAAILDNPDMYVGQPFPDAEVTVGSELTDRGFWIEQDGRRLFAIIIDEPAEEPKDINPQQRLRITGGTLRDESYLGEMPGDPLDQDTERLAREQEIFLVVDESNIEILQGGEPQPGTTPAQSLDTAGDGGRR
jgi:hypothetical protein